MFQQMPYRTGDQALVREINLSLIMRRLWEHSPISRAALAEITGLNKSTVSSLVSELIEHQFVREIGLQSTGIGRPSRLLELNPDAGFIVSAEIGVDFIAVLCANFTAEVLWQHRESTRGANGQQAILERTLALLRQAIDSARDPASGRTHLLGLALGVPGIVDHTTGMLLFAPNLGWKNVPLRDLLEQAFPGVPVFVDNEANLGALGEYFFGAAQGHSDLLYISVGVGLGGAILNEGRLFQGTTGFAGEFGHMTLDPDGRLCNCGNQGCWETLASQSVVFRQIREAVERGRTTALLEMTGGDLSQLTIQAVVDAAHAGDIVALESLHEVGHHLGIGIASLVNALNPGLVLFGGILSLAHEFLLPIIAAELEQRALRWSASAAGVQLGQYNLDACVMGGVATVYQTILAQPGNRTR